MTLRLQKKLIWKIFNVLSILPIKNSQISLSWQASFLCLIYFLFDTSKATMLITKRVIFAYFNLIYWNWGQNMVYLLWLATTITKVIEVYSLIIILYFTEGEEGADFIIRALTECNIRVLNSEMVKPIPEFPQLEIIGLGDWSSDRDYRYDAYTINYILTVLKAQSSIWAYSDTKFLCL